MDKLKNKMRVWLPIPSLKRKNLKILFSQVALRYNLVTRVLSFGRDLAWKKILISNLPIHIDPICVDIACGTGDLCFLLSKRYPKANIYGIDFCKNMLLIAQARNRWQNIHFIEEDMCHLTSINSNSVDVVTGGYALRNAPDLIQCIHEISRILKPGGSAAFLEFSRSSSKIKQTIQYIVLKCWGGLWGIMLHGNYRIYAYLAESLKIFPEKIELNRNLDAAGLTIVYAKPILLGMLEIIICKKMFHITT
jgi:ubiquinone/menaquinone biosynthesis methyltransferase